MIRRNMGNLSLLTVPTLIFAAVFILLIAVGNISIGSSDKGQERLEDGLRRAAVTCYANEGCYPPTLDYLKEHYGVQVDEERYIVYYEVFAENLMPDITVLKNGEGLL